jgi:hypothetical protein
LRILVVIYSGNAGAEVDFRNVCSRTPAWSVVAFEATRYVSWRKWKLKDFTNGKLALYWSLKSTLAIDLTRWLQVTWAHGAGQYSTRADRWQGTNRFSSCFTGAALTTSGESEPVMIGDDDRPCFLQAVAFAGCAGVDP